MSTPIQSPHLPCFIVYSKVLCLKISRKIINSDFTTHKRASTISSTKSLHLLVTIEVLTRCRRDSFQHAGQRYQRNAFGYTVRYSTDCVYTHNYVSKHLWSAKEYIFHPSPQAQKHASRWKKFKQHQNYIALLLFTTASLSCKSKEISRTKSLSKIKVSPSLSVTASEAGCDVWKTASLRDQSWHPSFLTSTYTIFLPQSPESMHMPTI